MSTSYGKAMQVLSCAPAQVRDSFSHYEGGISEAWILSYTGRPTKKTHGGRVPSGRPVDFGSTLGSRLTGQVRPSTHMDGYRVNQELAGLRQSFFSLLMRQTSSSIIADNICEAYHLQ